MKFISTQYIPLTNKGKQAILDPGEKLAYHARSFEWREVPETEMAQAVRAILEVFEFQVANIFSKIIPAQAKNADCERRRMGCVITDFHLETLAYGFNQKPKGLEGECRSIGCVPAITCRLTNHAEAVALQGVDSDRDQLGHILFNTAVPCLDCMKLCRQRNVKAVVYEEARDQSELDRPIMSAVSINSGIIFMRKVNA